MKNIRPLVRLLYLNILLGCSLSVFSQTKPGYDVAVYYFPQWHVDSVNIKSYGRPWTEWEVLQVAKPRFAGHAQPKVPLWGYEDEADPRVMSKKIEAAYTHGINVFLFDWYYFNEGPFLQRPLDDAFIKVDSGRMKFAIMWANHRTVTPAIFDSVIDVCINRYFKDPNYWTIDGEPYFCLYQLYTFIEGFGSVEKAAAAMQKFRDKTKAAGFKDLHLNAMQWGLHMPDSLAARPANELIDLFHVKTVDSYVWIHHTDMPHFPTTSYDYMMKDAYRYWDSAYKAYKVPYHPNVTMGWDSSPRTKQNVPFKQGEYPNFSVLTGNTPEKFKKALFEAKKFLDNKKPLHKILTINSWNEWTEGSYLEPDTKTKMEYLDAIKEVFGTK